MVSNGDTANPNMRWDADYHFPVLQCIERWSLFQPGPFNPSQPTLVAQLEARDGFRVGGCIRPGLRRHPSITKSLDQSRYAFINMKAT